MFLVPLAPLAVWGQGTNILVDPKQFGIDLPPGPLQPANGQRVSTMDEDGRLVVGRLHVQVGDAAIVLMPDGQLAARKRDEFSFTDRKFEPIDRGALAKRLVETEFKGFKSFVTPHYVCVYTSSDEFRIGTANILETMLDGVKKQLKACGLDVRGPELPLVVVLFRNKAEFQKYRKVSEDVIAYYHPLSNRVFLHEPVELGALSRDLALSQAVSTVAHEGAHQILQNIGVQQRLSAWPLWMSEGLAEYFAPTSFGKNLAWKGAGEINDLRMFELQRYLKKYATAAPDGRMIEGTVIAPSLSSTGYASAWAITNFLIKNEKNQFNRLLKETSQLGPLQGQLPAKAEGTVLANLEQFRKHFGDDVAALESRLVAYLKKVKYKDPFAKLPHFAVLIVVTVGQQTRPKAEIFYSRKLAEEWDKNQIAALPGDEQVNVFHEIKPFPNRAAAEVFLKSWRNKPQGRPVTRN